MTTIRPRRLRTTAAMRSLVRETRVSPAQLVLPVFVRDGLSEPSAIESMPGVVQHTLDSLRREAVRAARAGLGGLMLFGVPLDSDFVLDMRFLPNPFWVPELRALTGADQPVADYVLRQAGVTEFLDGVLAMLDPVLTGYVREGRRYVTLAIGCTGGKHRSVAMAEALAARLDQERVVPFLVHRDLGRE